jgi:hypothetical protein
MSLRIRCSGSLIRYPLGGFSWHQLQYLLGFAAMGHKVTYAEHFGWTKSCFDPSTNQQTSNPQYGLRYLADVLPSVGFRGNWCFVAEDGSTHDGAGRVGRRVPRIAMFISTHGNMNWTSGRAVPASDSDRHRSGLYADWHGMEGLSDIKGLYLWRERAQTKQRPIPNHHWLATPAGVVAAKWTWTRASEHAISTILN